MTSTKSAPYWPNSTAFLTSCFVVSVTCLSFAHVTYDEKMFNKLSKIQSLMEKLTYRLVSISPFMLHRHLSSLFSLTYIVFKEILLKAFKNLLENGLDKLSLVFIFNLNLHVLARMQAQVFAALCNAKFWAKDTYCRNALQLSEALFHSRLV